jgi:hypothetical protein
MDFDPVRQQIFDLAFQNHCHHPDVTVSAYREQIYASTWRLLNGKLVLYLDTKHWIHLRDVVLGRRTQKIHVQIYQYLRQLVCAGRVLCPLSFPIVTELTKQTDKKTRSATASIMDELSNSICVISPKEVAQRELENFITREVFERGVSGSVQETIWRKPMFMHGDPPMGKIGTNQSAANAMQKALLDVFESYSIQETTDMMDERGAFEMFPETVPIEALNEAKMRFAKQKASRERIFKAQKVAAIQDNQDALIEALHCLSLRYPSLAQEQLSGPALLQQINGLLFKKLKETEHQLNLPCLYVRAALQAEMQYDASRVIKETDIWDVAHATIGLPYADVLFFENSFTHLIKQQPFALDKFYKTEVISDDETILSWLKNLPV